MPVNQAFAAVLFLPNTTRLTFVVIPQRFFAVTLTTLRPGGSLAVFGTEKTCSQSLFASLNAVPDGSLLVVTVG